MQDWYGEQNSMAGHSNLEEEGQEKMGMWNNSSLEMNQPGNSSYKKMPPKVIIQT